MEVRPGKSKQKGQHTMANKPSSYADLIRGQEKLLAAVKEHAPNLPSVEIHHTALQQLVDQLKDAKARQDSLRASGQAATQGLTDLVNQAKLAAIRLRSVVRADMGPKSEQLVQFDVAPLRKRGRRAAKPPAVPPPTTPPAEAPTAPVEPAQTTPPKT
jgi:hypothetical protein